MQQTSSIVSDTRYWNYHYQVRICVRQSQMYILDTESPDEPVPTSLQAERCTILYSTKCLSILTALDSDAEKELITAMHKLRGFTHTHAQKSRRSRDKASTMTALNPSNRGRLRITQALRSILLGSG